VPELDEKERKITPLKTTKDMAKRENAIAPIELK